MLPPKEKSTASVQNAGNDNAGCPALGGGGRAEDTQQMRTGSDPAEELHILIQATIVGQCRRSWPTGGGLCTGRGVGSHRGRESRGFLEVIIAEHMHHSSARRFFSCFPCGRCYRRCWCCRRLSTNAWHTGLLLLLLLLLVQLLMLRCCFSCWLYRCSCTRACCGIGAPARCSRRASGYCFERGLSADWWRARLLKGEEEVGKAAKRRRLRPPGCFAVHVPPTGAGGAPSQGNELFHELRSALEHQSLCWQQQEKRSAMLALHHITFHLSAHSLVRLRQNVGQA